MTDRNKLRILLFALFSMAFPLIFMASPTPRPDSEPSKKKERVDSITLFGRIFDRLTSRDVVEAKVEALRADSSLISQTIGGYSYTYLNNRNSLVRDSTSKYSISIPRVEGDYILRVTKAGYEPLYYPYRLENLTRRTDEKEVPKIYLSRQKVKTLDEFTVKASKVMFYHKGDTIVYNADAFALPEGSMLDALVAQMPGVEVKGDKIYVNGRFVDALLLNGKDFFRGNNSVMLENVGAYTVKDVAVYEKKDEMAYVLGEDREDVDKEFVMDVRLKKDYMTGYILNAQAGAGTASRYLGRLFAMQYTNNTRLALYGNINNINKSSNLSDSNTEIILDEDLGITKRITGGLDYQVDNAAHTWELGGMVDASYIDNKNSTITNTVNFFPDNDTYEFSDLSSRSRDFKISTNHNWKLKKEKWNIAVKPKFSYNKNRNNDETTAAAFREEMQELDAQIVKAIYSGNYPALQAALINRNLKVHESDGHGWDSQLNAEARVKVPGSPDAMAIKFQTKYSRSSQFGNTLQDICFGAAPETSMLQNRSSSTRPRYNFNIQGLVRYYFNIPMGNLHASYEYAHTQTRKNSDIYLMEAMAQDGMAEFAPDQIPVPDIDNCYTSKLYKDEHRIKLNWYYTKKLDNGGVLDFTFQPYFDIERQNLFYHRGDNEANPHRTYLKFNITEARAMWRSKNRKNSARLTYKMTTNAVNMVDLVDIRNTTDPLNVIEGNPDLRNSIKHDLSFYVNLYHSKSLSQFMHGSAIWNQNAFVKGYRYDSATGARVTKTYNVGGNQNYRISHNVRYRFGRNQEFQLDNDLNLFYYQYANMIGYDEEPQKQRVRNYNVGDYLQLSYNVKKKMSISLVGSVAWQNSHSEGEMFTKLNSGTAMGGLEAWFRLPLNFQVSTEFGVRKRFGYVEDSMNSTDFIWNADLSYSLRQGQWRFVLDAKDILNQNKGIVYMVNAQGRTQTLDTVLPRYLMLSVQYFFDFKPKRK